MKVSGASFQQDAKRLVSTLRLLGLRSTARRLPPVGGSQHFSKSFESLGRSSARLEREKLTC
jgi:hypothetical protein